MVAMRTFFTVPLTMYRVKIVTTAIP